MDRANAARRGLSIVIDLAVSLIWWVAFARIEHGPGAVRLSWFGWRAVFPVILTLAYFALLPMFVGTTVGMLAMRLRSQVVIVERNAGGSADQADLTTRGPQVATHGVGQLPPPPADIPPPI